MLNNKSTTHDAQIGRSQRHARQLASPLVPRFPFVVDPGLPLARCRRRRIAHYISLISLVMRLTAVAVGLTTTVVVKGSGGDPTGRLVVLEPWSRDWIDTQNAYSPLETAVAAVLDKHRDTYRALMADLGPIVSTCPSRLSIALFIWALDELGVDLDDETAVNEWLTDDGIARVCELVEESPKLTTRPFLRDQNLVRIGMTRGVTGLTPRNQLRFPLVRTVGWFNPAEMWQFISDCDMQRSRYNCERARKILTLTFGAGLTATEVADVGQSNIYEAQGSVWVDVQAGPKPRRVPVDDDFAHLILGLRNMPGQDLLHGTRDAGQLQRVQRINQSLLEGTWTLGVRPLFRAMNLTWLRNRVMANADMSAVFAASQYKTMKVFARCLDEADLVTSGQWRSVSRPHPDSEAPR